MATVRHLVWREQIADVEMIDPETILMLSPSVNVAQEPGWYLARRMRTRSIYCVIGGVGEIFK